MRTLTALLTLFADNALAHPGEHHGSFFTALGHLLSEPDHLAMIVIALIGGGVFARRRFQSGRARKQP